MEHMRQDLFSFYENRRLIRLTTLRLKTRAIVIIYSGASNDSINKKV
ncbi:MAG: hypothetical protein ACI8UG_000777 [Gammaproteobacteria bacterium]|jgi:hypothetical protein